MNLLYGLWNYGGFKLRGTGFPKFSAPPSGETIRRIPKVWRHKNVVEIIYHRAKFGSARTSHAAGAITNVEFFCVFVMLLNDKDVCMISLK